MNRISYAENIRDVDSLLNNGIKEIIVSCKELSRLHRNTFDEMLELALFIKKNQGIPILEWDVLSTENILTESMKLFLKIPLHEFSAIRVQDPGIVHFIKNNYSWLKIHLILETGNHNIIGLKKWEEYLGEQLARLVLSNELSKESLKSYVKELKTPIEILVFGRILLFYSPRKLLTPLDDKPFIENYKVASGTSEESPHSGFPLIENMHGTFMFNVKDLSLLDHLDEIKEMGISYIRFDLRFDEAMLYLKNLHDFKGPRPLVKGFYNINKTDILFSKLKNRKMPSLDDSFLGVVVDVERDKNMAILVKRKEFKRSANLSLKIFTPDGKEKKLAHFSLKNSADQTIEEAICGDILICTYLNGVSVKSQVYLA